jgi:hypothetical protein
MKLSQNATIAPLKLTQYLLQYQPQDDKSLFLAKAGYTIANWQQLEQDLRSQILVLEAIPTRKTQFGQKYEIRGTLRGTNGKELAIVTIWMIETETSETKFITLLPDKENRT